MKRLLGPVLLAAAALSLAGCETYKEYSFTGKLWGDDSVGYYHEPKSEPKLQLFALAGTQDVLVQYDEGNEHDGGTRRRAYLLHANDEKIQAQKKPRFIHPGPDLDMTLIPFSDAGTNSPVPGNVSAQISPDGRGFTLFRDGQAAGSYHLPVYVDRRGQIKCICLTPVTVLVDGTIVVVGVGVVAGCVGVIALCQSNATIKN